MSELADEVRIRIKKKEEELVPGNCIYAFTENVPKLELDYVQLEYEGRAYIPLLTTESRRAELTAGTSVKATASITNETGDGPIKALLLVGYKRGSEVVVLARSGWVELPDGYYYNFDADFYMEDKALDIVLMSMHYRGEGLPECPIGMSEVIYTMPTPHACACQLGLLEDPRLGTRYEVRSGVTLTLASAAYNCGGAAGGLYTSLYVGGTRVESEQKQLDTTHIEHVQGNYVAARWSYTMPSAGSEVEVRRVGGHGGYINGDWGNVVDFDETTTLVATESEGTQGIIYTSQTKPNVSGNQIIGSEISVQLAIKNTSNNTGLLKGTVSGIPETEPYSYNRNLIAGEVAVMPTTLTFAMPSHEVRITYQVFSEGRDGLRTEPDETQVYVLSPITGTPEEVTTTGAWQDTDGSWKVGVELLLEGDYANALAGIQGYYKYYYEINVKSEDGLHEIYARTPSDKSKFHLETSNLEMNGRAKLNWDPAPDPSLIVELWRTNIDTGIEKKVFETTATIPGNRFVLRTPRAEFLYPLETFQEPLFGFFVPVPLQPPLAMLSCSDPPCEFILTEEDGLEEGKLYVFQSSLSVAPLIHLTQVVPAEYVYKFEGAKTIDVVPLTDFVSGTLCGFLDIEPGSTECRNLLLEFIDPYYVANAISRLVRHETLVGDEEGPDILDIIFVPLALASGILPAGGAGKRFFGKILAKARSPATKELNDVGVWIERNRDLISASIIRGYKSDVELAIGRIAEAADKVPGSSDQAKLLESAKEALEETIRGTDWSTAVSRADGWVDEIYRSLGKAGSETPAAEVIERSGVKRAADYIRGIGKINIDDLDTLEKTKRGARANKGTIAHEGVLYDIDKLMVKDGKVTQYYKPRLPGLWNAMKRHKLITAGLFSWFFIMGPWFTIDNTQFIIYLLRAAGVLNKTWGDQWEENASRRFDAYMQLKEDPCEHAYQAQLVFALEQLRELLDSADPIPEGKIKKAKYILSVLYGFDIGDPNEVVKAGCETDFDAWNHWYYEITRGCTAPLEPSFGVDMTYYPKPRFQVKVERIVDGDTIEVSCTDEEWPHSEDTTVRVLGYDTPDVITAGNTILGYSVRRKAIPEGNAPEDPTTPVLREDYYAPTTWMSNIINKQYVWIEIDPNNQTGSHGRLLATIEVDHKDYSGDLGEGMLRKGYAKVFFYTPNALMDTEMRGKYLAAETIARNAKLGVWSGEAEALPTGKIRCDSTPDKAYIYLDDETAPLAATDATLDDITIGNHNVEFKGLTYSGVTCEDCKCGYHVIVKEDTKETVMCNLSAVCEIMQPKWEDDSGIRLDRFPTIWLDDGISKSPIGVPNAYPFEITFGKSYTGLGEYTIIRNGPGLLARDCDNGEWTVEIRLEGYKTLSSSFNFKPGVYKRVIPLLWKGTGDGGEIPEEVPEPEPEPEVGVGYLTINRPIIAGTTAEVSGHIKVHIDGIYISRYAGYGTTRNIRCCASCYCNADKDLGDCSLGTHTLKLTKTGYEEWSETIVLEGNKTTEVTAEMTLADGTVTGAVGAVSAEDTYVNMPSTYSATIVNTGTKTACYRMKCNFTGIGPGVAGKYYEYPLRFEDEPDDGWSASIEPGEEVVVAVTFTLPEDTIPEHAETARYEIGAELQAAEAL